MSQAVAYIINFLCTCNEAFWLFYIVEQLLEKRSVFKKDHINMLVHAMATVGLVFITIVLNNFSLTSPYTTLIAILYSVISIFIIWKNNFLTAIAVTGGYYFALFFVGMIELLLIVGIGGEKLIALVTREQGYHRIVFLLVAGPIWFALSFKLSSYLKKIVSKERKKTIAIISVMGIVGMTFLSIQILTSFSIVINLLALAFVLFFAIILFGGYYMIKNKEWKEEKASIEERNTLLEQKYNEINQYYVANAKLYHDMNHHLKVIYSMAENEKSSEILDYVSGIEKMSEAVRMKRWTGVDIIDTILTEKEHIAQKKEIHMSLEAHMIPADLNISNQDLCSLFANLLDNAIEAQGTKIEVIIKVVREMLLVQIRNDYNHELSKKNGRYQTHKKGSHHGWGIRNIEDIIDKYDGSMEIKNENGVFEVDLLLNLY